MSTLNITYGPTVKSYRAIRQMREKLSSQVRAQTWAQEYAEERARVSSPAHRCGVATAEVTRLQNEEERISIALASELRIADQSGVINMSVVYGLSQAREYVVGRLRRAEENVARLCG